MTEQLFTVDEANALLPQIEVHLAQARAARATLLGSAKQITEHASHNGGASTPPLAQEAQDELAAAISSLTDLGIVLRDLESGLLDFPSQRGEETVYLCWRSGEDAVEHWHPTDTGFSDRRSLNEL